MAQPLAAWPSANPLRLHRTFSPSLAPPIGLADEEADTIRRRLVERRRGPALLTWLEQALQDREERRQRERESENEKAEQP
jgi:hypothetical protein